MLKYECVPDISGDIFILTRCSLLIRNPCLGGNPEFFFANFGTPTSLSLNSWIGFLRKPNKCLRTSQEVHRPCLGRRRWTGLPCGLKEGLIDPRGSSGRGFPAEGSGTGRWAWAFLPSLHLVTGHRTPKEDPDHGGCNCQRLTAIPGEGHS